MKGIVLAEVALLLGGNVVIRLSKGASYTDIVVKDIQRPALAAAILLILLLLAVEIGLGGPAVLFGGLLVLGYLLAGSGVLGKALEDMVNDYLVVK